ncbi:RNA-guided endonuclease InsQ/TnpB family protein [Nocardioides sp. Leaf285]|uniref:RNA-guided endonuclease InsQ/TnpB family protein n=1 Tax=Nocardioides sp. Leaf285 TaxID=1736322 RepID=UPI0007037E33|nr:RNA-guided endonuclease TnpB family protein [Nocardioides sp. Leaf285]KQP62952.1 hypothetical protein ASF47_18235 [Nocardioides sp. Leaf285]
MKEVRAKAAPAPRVTVVRTFKFRLDPTPSQEERFAQHAGAARVAFNFAVTMMDLATDRWHALRAGLMEQGMTREEATEALRGRSPVPRKGDVQRAFNRCKGSMKPGSERAGEFPWWDQPGREVGTYAFQDAFANAERAYANYIASMSGRRRGSGMRRPRLKKKGRSVDSFGARGQVSLVGYRAVKIPVIGPVRTLDPRLAKKMTRLMARGSGRISGATISRGGKHWYVALTVPLDPAAVPVPGPTRAASQRGSAGAVGVDLGVSLLAATSDDRDPQQTFDRLAPARASHTRMLRAQRSLARTKTGSRRRRKAARRVGALHHTISLQRATAQHALTAHLTSSYALIGIEDLRVANMTRRVAPTPDPNDPGRFLKNGQRSKSGLNRSILDVGWGEIRRQLTYKAERRGITLVAVPAMNTSRRCNECGHVAAENRKSQAVFACVACGHTRNADVNAAHNILTAALAIRAPLGHGGPPPLTEGNGDTRDHRNAAMRMSEHAEGGAPEPGKPGRGDLLLTREACEPLHATVRE